MCLLPGFFVEQKAVAPPKYPQVAGLLLGDIFVEKPAEEKEKMEELFTDGLAFAIASIARHLVLDSEDKIRGKVEPNEKLPKSNL
ncbi:MAG: hypothetical protein A3J46_04700 [Candidatus Yanofskybacteria bacterium RIFCSPHIGHO2_02_FULL_41_11]|uniref:Uncharacterized protein n=1 Tax=Candidatus Yanofskybacteria bacterium RIFCSPHIGHO2_02_FULL_41_11 TaxID=1802675 RepID=A0A1F8F9M7_9BACT|nr:MAG: hypothetical protein A3J46_04700 [Candidatus Yanofskybacteria bacterium RIFCSPHIGHO2_02_FULL_41_11]